MREPDAWIGSDCSVCALYDLLSAGRGRLIQEAAGGAPFRSSGAMGEPSSDRALSVLHQVSEVLLIACTANRNGCGTLPEMAGGFLRSSGARLADGAPPSNGPPQPLWTAVDALERVIRQSLASAVSERAQSGACADHFGEMLDALRAGAADRHAMQAETGASP